jgi:hypothetical protein
MLLGARLVVSSLGVASWMVSRAAADGYFFPNSTFYPENPITTACSTAIQAQLNCSTDLMTYAYADSFYPVGNDTYLQGFCVASCSSSLAQYVQNVQTACAGQQPFQGLPATYYGDFALSTWNLTCLQDPATGEYCIGNLIHAVSRASDRSADNV